MKGILFHLLPSCSEIIKAEPSICFYFGGYLLIFVGYSSRFCAINQAIPDALLHLHPQVQVSMSSLLSDALRYSH